MKTKDRIRETARLLFNEHQFGKVTTAMLAAELGISEGNLWYHFRTKRALLDAISEQYLQAVDQRSAIAPDPEKDVLAQYVDFLITIARELARFRFIYRDRADYGEHSDVLQAKIPEIYAVTRYQFEQFFYALRAAGHLEIDEERIEPVVMNGILIFRYAHEFFREAGLPSMSTPKAVLRGMEQHLSVYEERLSRPALEAIKTGLAEVELGESV